MTSPLPHTLGHDGSWDPRAARAFRLEHGLWLIDAAARACGVFDGRRSSPAGERTVGVAICGQHWLLFPVDNGWVAAARGVADEPDHAHSLWLRRGLGERHVPTAAWGRFLSGDLPVTDGEPAPPERRVDQLLSSTASAP